MRFLILVRHCYLEMGPWNLFQCKDAVLWVNIIVEIRLHIWPVFFHKRNSWAGQQHLYIQKASRRNIFFFKLNYDTAIIAIAKPCPFINKNYKSFMAKKWTRTIEHLRSEIPPTAPWLPILGNHIRSKVKTRQSQSYIFLKIAKNSNFEILQKKFACNTPSEVAW